MTDSIYHRTLKLLIDCIFGVKFKILPSFTQHYNERHYVTLLNLKTTSSLSILLHDVISLPEATSK